MGRIANCVVGRNADKGRVRYLGAPPSLIV